MDFWDILVCQPKKKERKFLIAKKRMKGKLVAKGHACYQQIMHVVGITGGLAAGKSTVAHLLRQQGAHVWDADVFARQVILPTQEAYEPVVALLGTEILSEQRDPETSLPLVDRSRLAACLFAHSSLRKQVEQIMHPAIWRRFIKEVEQWRQQGGRLAFWEATLLVETGRYKLLSGLVVVDVPELLQQERALNRGMREEDVLQRLQAQQLRWQRLRHATWVIDNRGLLEQTKMQVQRLWHSLCLQTGEDLC